VQVWRYSEFVPVDHGRADAWSALESTCARGRMPLFRRGRSRGGIGDRRSHLPHSKTGGFIAGFQPRRIAVAEQILTLSELAVYMNVPRRRLYRLVTRHHSFPVFKNGRHWCVDVDAVCEWLLDRFDEEATEFAKKDKRRTPKSAVRNHGAPWRKNLDPSRNQTQ
jgi:excisionase family DNA binding protein